MFASEFIKGRFLADAFGESRVIETAKRLRELDLFPKGQKHIDYRSATILIYTLAASSKLKDVPLCAQAVFELHSRSGSKFLDDFVFLLTLDSQLLTVKNIHISRRTGNVIIFYTNDEFTIYTTDAILHSKESYLAEAIEIDVIIKKPWLIHFKLDLIQEESIGAYIGE